MIKRNFDQIFVWLIVSMGVLLPWAVGFVIKVYLDFKGEPTWDWFYFLHPGRLIVEVWATFWLAAPSLLLGIFAHLMFRHRIPFTQALTPWETRIIVIASALWGAAGSVPVFIEMFRKFHPVSFIAPFFHTVLYLDDYLIGLVTGVFLALASLGIRRLKRGE